MNVFIAQHSSLNGCQLNVLHPLECGLAFSELSVVGLLIWMHVGTMGNKVAYAVKIYCYV